MKTLVETAEPPVEAGAAEPAAGATLPQLIAARAARAAEAVAMVRGHDRLTYGELDRRVRELACYLRALGVSPETRVAICLERSPAVVVAILAVLRAGGVYVPLDPAYPGERSAAILDDAAPAVVVTHSGLEKILPSTAAAVVCVDRDAAAIADAGAGDPGPGPAPGHLAYLIYTSGSTGRPKGVAIEHRSAVNLVRWAAAAFTARELAGMLAGTSINFDLSVFELFVPLTVGGKVILADTALELPRLPAAAEVTFVNTVPSVCAELVRAAPLPESVRTVGLAGEPLRRELVKRIAARGRGARIVNLYAPSETTTYSTAAEIAAGGEDEPAIGRPIANTRAHVLDPKLRPVDVGDAGGLYLGGAGVARGYFGRPRQTAAAFLPDPFAVTPCGVRLYRTGDRVRQRPDGQLDFLGRADHQVKIRGFRIELGEVEAALDRHPAVRAVAVTAREDEAGERYLAAYVVPEPPASPTVSELREFLAPILPVYMLPRAFAFPESLPLTPSGKVDRRALPAPERVRPAAAARLVAPKGPVETTIAAIWAEVLRCAPVGAHDNFFDLGGHSLAASRVLTRVHSALGVELSPSTPFRQPTVAGLAAAVASARQVETGEPAAGDSRGAAESPVSLSQEGLYFLERWRPGTATFNVPLALELGGPLEIGALAASLDEIARRHEVLRSSYPAVEGIPRLRVAPPRGLPLAVVDLRGLPPGRRRAERGRQLAREARRPIDLATGPVVRARLLRLAGEESVLLLVMHHIVTDDWSHQVLLRELSALYRACRGRQRAAVVSPLARLTVSYRDFVAWQRRRLRAEVIDELLAWWRRQLQDAPVGLELPADRPRPAEWSSRGARCSRSLPQRLATRLETLGRRQGVSTFTVFLAAFAAWLFRHTAQRDLIMGTPIANRARREFEDLIGYFLNSLALRLDLAGDPTFEELVARVREVFLGAFAHGELPFHRLVEALRPEAAETQAPLYQAVLVWQNERPPALAPDVGLDVEELDTGTAKFDLTLFLKGCEEGLTATAEYNADLFDASSVHRMLEHWRNLLEAVAADPGQRLSEAPLLSAAEIQQLLREWAGAGAPYPREATLHGLFEARAAAAPEAVAVTCGEARLSYRELDRRANRLAHRLRQHVAGRGEACVGLCAERSPEMVVGMLGILKAGAAYVPLDPSLPDRRLALMAQDLRMPVVVAQDRLAERLAPAAEVISPTAPGGADGSPPPGAAAAADHLAYVMFTSGSTGRPKGVAVTHRNVIRLVRGTRYAEMDRRQVFLQLAPISFDASTLEIWGPLANGGHLVAAPPRAPSLQELRETVERHRVTTLWLTAGLFHQLVDDGLAGLGAVRQLLAGGDVLSARHVRRALAELAACTVINGYGPTENTTFTCCHPMAGAAAAAGDSVPIGRPIANTRVHVLDQWLWPVAAGVAGELCAGGDGLARGYASRPALTAASFVPDPLSTAPGDRLYRTGDLVRWLPDGRVDFLGRRDQQVKLRGFRIEPGEIEAVLEAHPAVAQAVVMPRRLRESAPRTLAAYLVAGGPAPPRIAELREHLGRRLPEYMIPASFRVLDALPLTANGKVDRAALGRLELPEQQAETGRRFVAPRTTVERSLAAIWTDMLGLERVGAEDDFFQLGGHSLLALRLISRIRAGFQVELTPQDVFDLPTVAALARRIGELQRAAAGLRVPPPEPLLRDAETELPLSFAEQRMWLLDRYHPGDTSYNITAAIRLRGPLDAAALERGLAEIARRHESLRTVYPAAGGLPRRRLLPARELALQRATLTDRGGEEESESAVRRLLAAELGRPFDLAAGPLLRAGLVRRDAEDHVVWLSVHHIVADGWSMGILMNELAALYNAYRRGEPSPLPEPPLSYADFACWQRRWLSGEVLRGHLEYWRRQLGENPRPLPLPTDRPRPATPSGAGARLPFELPDDLRAALESLGRQERTTPFVTFLAAFQALVWSYTGEETILVGTPVAGRNRVEVEDLIGLFVNTLVIRADLSGDPDFRELLARVRRVTLEAYDHQDAPFDKVVEALQKERDPSRHPLFQVLFDYQEASLADLRLEGLQVDLVATETTTAKFDLTLAIGALEGTLAGTVEYATELFEASTITRMIGHYTELLKEVAAAPGRPLSELAALRRVARDPLLAAGSRSGAETASADERERVLAQRQEDLSRRRAGLTAARRALLEKWTRRKAPAPGLPRRPADAPAELSFAQQRLWFLDQMEPGSALYNIPLAVSMEGPLRADALELSLDEIARRHETLRTTFSATEGHPHQVIAESFRLPLPRIDLRALPAARRRAEAGHLARKEARRPFDLERGPVIRTSLLMLGETLHMLLVTLHHICSDAWSLGLFVRELGILYKAFTAGRSPSSGAAGGLPELPVQYADFAVWQRRHLTGEVLEEQLAYWRRQLAGTPAALELPCDRRRPPRFSFRGATRDQVIPQALTGRLEELAQRQGATLFMTLLAAFFVLLHRYTGQRDLVVGSPIAGRNRSEIEGLIGFFVNTLVLRADLSGHQGREPTFERLAERVREVALGAYAHQDLPFEKLLEELRPERNRSQTPLFQVAFAFENTPAEVAELADLGLAGLTLSPVETSSATAKFDLSVLLQRGPRGLAGSFEYAADLFDDTTIARMGEHFRTLLESIVARPEARLSALEMLPPCGRWQVLGEWNDTAAPVGRDRCVHELFEAQAERAPEAVAVSSGDRWLSYRELDLRAERLAHRLRRRGVGPEVPAAVLMERSPELVAGILGILKAGGAYVPMDPSFPAARLALLLEDLGAPVVVTVERLAAKLPEGQARIVLAAGGSPEPAPQSRVTSDHLAYVIYTSGSTGRPKGVRIEHAALLNLVAWHRRTYGITPGDRATLVAGPAFDASVWETWPYLTAGASLHVVDPETAAAAPELVEWLAARRITHAFLPTPLAEAALSQAWPETALQALIIGGDQLHRRGRRGLTFHPANHYGPTESTVVTTWAPVAPDGETGTAPPIGRPLTNLQVYLLGPPLAPMPPGAAGELAIGGVGLSRGYLGRAGLTAEKFVPDPFGSEPGGRLYKTGDRARHLADGNLEFLGRIDTQVKVRGFRIELGEVETVLGQHPAVREAAVIARGDGGEKRLVAYVVAGGELRTHELRHDLKARLPEYMVPTAFVELDALPLNANGKVDRRALPAPDAGRPDLKAGYVAPRDAVEEALAGLWADALGLDEVGVDDDFFELGGHSLLATRLISRIRKAFRVELPLASLFEATTVAAMARLLAAGEPRPGQTEKIARALLKVRAMSAEDVRQTLARKKEEAKAHG